MMILFSESAVADTSTDTTAFALAVATEVDLVRNFRIVVEMEWWESSPNGFCFGGIKLQQDECTPLVQH